MNVDLIVEILTAVAPIIVSIVTSVIIGVYIKLQTAKGVSRSEIASGKAEIEMLNMAKLHTQEMQKIQQQLDQIKAKLKSKGK